MAEPSPEKLTALIVDDNPDDRTLVARTLRKEFPELEAAEASDSETFHRALNQARFDVIITDYQLNWSDGLTLLPSMRKRQPGCPIIMFTDSGSEQVAVDAMKLGVEDYILKSPRRFVCVAASVRKALAKVQAGKRAEALEAASRVREEENRQAQKLESVGKLAAGVAHDFNNMLTAIIGYSELLMETVSAPNPALSSISEIHSSAKRAAALTRELLAFGRKQMLFPERVDLNGFLSQMDPVVRRMAGEKVEVTILLADGIGKVKVDPEQFRIAVMNLVANALEAMAGGGRLTLQTGIKKDVLFLLVADTGAGMEKEIQSRIFDPFFTTKKSLHHGNGLGLSTAYGIVKQSGGAITVDSSPGQGSRFAICFPRIPEENPAVNENPSRNAVPASTWQDP